MKVRPSDTLKTFNESFVNKLIEEVQVVHTVV